MKKQLQKNNKKYVSAEEIFDFLKSVAVNGVVNMTRQDLAAHFNYKTGNGDGFRANIKMLESEGLITDISKDKRHPAWKIDMESDFDFAAHPVISTRKKEKNEHGGVNMSKQTKNVKGLDLEQIHIINYMGRKYVQLMDITKALGIDRRHVYNAVTNSSKLVGPYIKSLPLNPGAQAKKAIELEGITYLFSKLENKVNPKILKALKDYIENTSSTESEGEEFKSTTSSTVVHFPIEVTANNSSHEEESTNNFEDKELSNSIDVEPQQLSLPDISDMNSMDISDILTFLDGLTTILREHSEMKEIIEEKDNLILSLQDEIKNLKSELLNKIDSSETESLRKELLETQKELSKTKEELSNINILKAQILAKASQMKNFMKENNPTKPLYSH